MKIGVVSDTHSKKMPRQMIDDFKKVDCIVHVGDFCSISDYEMLKKIKEVKGVCGNMDGPELCRRLPKKLVFSCGRFKVGLFHGTGRPGNILQRVKKEFEHDKVGVVIFGHSHNPLNEKVGGVLYFNPGSPNDEIFAPYCSYGILEVTDDGILGKIIKVKE